MISVEYQIRDKPWTATWNQFVFKFVAVNVSRERSELRAVWHIRSRVIGQVKDDSSMMLLV